MALRWGAVQTGLDLASTSIALRDEQDTRIPLAFFIPGKSPVSAVAVNEGVLLESYI